MEAESIRQTTSTGGRLRLTTLVTMAAFVSGVLRLIRRRLNFMPVTRALREEKDIMCAAPAQAQDLKSMKDITNAKDSSLDEILQIVRIAQEVQTVTEPYEEKNRRVIDSREFCDEIRVMRYAP